ncbi:hypothetical protein, partial [Candidatus Tokpelaia sp.]|uniref:hypothetical protein n=1 Tax=Candidatus Tokpelaia sp. TaxID=2233777 RepID=UPI001239671E
MTIKVVKWWLVILAILGLLSFLTQGLLSLAKQGEHMQARIREQAKAECTAYWQAEIAKSNAAALRRQNELQEKALIAE